MNYTESIRGILSTTVDVFQATSKYAEGAAQFGADILHVINGEETYGQSQYRGNHDTMTHTYNRDGLPLSVTRLTEKTDSHRYMAVFVDMIGLRDLNNEYSHAMGDHALKVTAWTIKKLFRLSKEFAESRRDKSLVARWGGDEFVALMPINHSFDADLASSLVYTTGNSGRGDDTTQNVTELDCIELLRRCDELNIPTLIQNSLRIMQEAGITSISYRYDVGPVSSDGVSSEGALRNIEQFMAEHGSKYIRK